MNTTYLPFLSVVCQWCIHSLGVKWRAARGGIQPSCSERGCLQSSATNEIGHSIDEYWSLLARIPGAHCIVRVVGKRMSCRAWVCILGLCRLAVWADVAVRGCESRGDELNAGLVTTGSASSWWLYQVLRVRRETLASWKAQSRKVTLLSYKGQSWGKAVTSSASILCVFALVSNWQELCVSVLRVSRMADPCSVGLSRVVSPWEHFFEKLFVPILIVPSHEIQLQGDKGCSIVLSLMEKMSIVEIVPSL